MNIKFEGSLTKEEFKDSVKLANRPIKENNVNIDFWVVLVLAGTLLAFAGLRLLFASQNTGLGVFLLAGGVVLFMFGMKLRAAVDRAWEELQKTDAKREGLITEEYLEIRNSVSNSQNLWTGFNGYGEYRNLLLLFQGNVAYPFSIRFFQNETDWQEFRKFVVSKLPMTHQIQSNMMNSSNRLLLLLFLFSAGLIFVYLTLKDTR